MELLNLALMLWVFKNTHFLIFIMIIMYVKSFLSFSKKIVKFCDCTSVKYSSNLFWLMDIKYQVGGGWFSKCSKFLDHILNRDFFRLKCDLQQKQRLLAPKKAPVLKFKYLIGWIWTQSKHSPIVRPLCEKSVWLPWTQNFYHLFGNRYPIKQWLTILIWVICQH